MVNIPLIQGNSIQDINTSIIAIKKAQKELESLNAFVDNKIKALNLALSGGVGKFIQSISQTEGQIAVEVGELTDIIASGNNQPATSQGVANALSGKVNTDTYTDTNLNTLINTGLYSVGWLGQSWENLNFPIQNFGTVLVGTSPSGNLLQMFMPDGTQVVYVRNCTTHIWSSWKKVLTNDDVTDTVASNNMHSVTSDAVADKLTPYMKPPDGAGDASTLAGLENTIVQGQFAPACCGSQQITDGPDGDVWYNFIYIPHRTGVGQDNYQYGSLLLFNMTSNTNNMWICHLLGGTWYPPQKISA
jgi:hypothetical protein